MYLLKRLGFTVDEIRGMTMLQVQFWLETIGYDAELMAEPAGEGAKEIRSLDELKAVLPKEEKKD
jgi:hypothetical protein